MIRGFQRGFFNAEFKRTADDSTELTATRVVTILADQLDAQPGLSLAQRTFNPFEHESSFSR
jgi:hypothetical protein